MVKLFLIFNKCAQVPVMFDELPLGAATVVAIRLPLTVAL